MTKMIINADDFGLNSSVNKAIIELFNQRLISSTTLMANMPGFEEAINLAHKYNLTKQIGVHLVLTEGVPLTKEIIAIPFLFKGKDCYRKSKYRLLILRKKNKELIYKEFAAQIEKIQLNNIAITHIDTHHHVHEMYGITKILLELSRKYDIPSIRILNNMEKATKTHKKIYRTFINRYIRKKHANYSDYFGHQSDLIIKIKEDPTFINKKMEIMVHPDYNEDGKIIDKAWKNFDFNFLQNLKNASQTSSISL